MTVIVLPSVSRILAKRGFAAQFINLWVIRFSLFVVIIGFIVMWLAIHPIQIGTGQASSIISSLYIAADFFHSFTALWHGRRIGTLHRGPRLFNDSLSIEC